MKERIGAFREHLAKIEDDSVFDSIATLSKDLAEDFKEKFPEHPASAYENNPLWQMVVGSTTPEDYINDTPKDVQIWLEKKLTEFLDNLNT